VGLALLLFGAAAFHVVRVLAPLEGDTSSPLRHALFAVVDALMGVGLLTRPPGFSFWFGLFVLQQVYSHGIAALRAWLDRGAIDVLSLVIVVLLPLGWLLSRTETRSVRGHGR
jgi:hypothetical protein